MRSAALADLSRIQSLGILVITRVVDLLVLFALVLLASFVLPAHETAAIQRFQHHYARAHRRAGQRAVAAEAQTRPPAA